MAPTLTTDRLTLHPHRPDDLDEMIAMWEEPAVHALITGRPFTRQESWERLLRYIGHWEALGWGNWLIRETATGRLVGNAGFMDSRRDTDPNFEGTPEVGWALASWAHGQGFAREALAAVFAWGDAYPFARTVCIINPANAASIKLAEHMGYRLMTRGKYGDRPTLFYERFAGALAPSSS